MFLSVEIERIYFSYLLKMSDFFMHWSTPKITTESIRVRMGKNRVPGKEIEREEGRN